MSIETIEVYSPDKIYGELTRPFQGDNEKPVVINSHTMYDEEDDEAVVFTKNNFYNNLSKMQVSIEDIHDIKGLELDETITTNVVPAPADFPPKNALPSFQLSNLTNGSGVVYEALQNGYTGNQSIVISKAHNAYANVLKQDLTDTIQSLVNKSYTVKQ